jgi:hypothetical protein
MHRYIFLFCGLLFGCEEQVNCRWVREIEVEQQTTDCMNTPGCAVASEELARHRRYQKECQAGGKP